MSDRLLRRSEIAAMLGTSEGMAVDILSENGLYPIDFGHGRGRGPRWLESAVIKAIRDMHIAAQEAHAPPEAKNKILTGQRLHLDSMTPKQLFKLTRKPRVE